MTLYRRIGKRTLDLLLVGLSLPVAIPVVGILAVAIRLTLGTPVFFRQRRPGMLGRPFMLIKFRTMLDLTDGLGRPLADDERMHPFGSLLRRTSLDELPELWNVLRGDMSLVGPRPLLEEYLPFYTERQSRRHEVRPGLTGWAQINGRNAIDWPSRFELDLWYVENVSFSLDVTILLRTIVTIVKRKGVSAEGHVTMPKFSDTVVHRGHDR